MTRHYFTVSGKCFEAVPAVFSINREERAMKKWTNMMLVTVLLIAITLSFSACITMEFLSETALAAETDPVYPAGDATISAPPCRQRIASE